MLAGCCLRRGVCHPWLLMMAEAARAPPADVVGVKLWPLVFAVSADEIEHAPVGSAEKWGRSRARRRMAKPLRWSMVGQSHTLRETPKNRHNCAVARYRQRIIRELDDGWTVVSRSPCQSQTRQRRQRHLDVRAAAG